MNPYLSLKDKMELLERWILIHSHLYYNLDHPIVDDYRFDRNSNQLYKYIEKNPAVFKETRYYYAMKDFDGSTGFGLFEKLNKDDKFLLETNAAWIVDLDKKMKRGENK